MGLLLLSTGIRAQTHNDSIPKSARSMTSKTPLHTHTEAISSEEWSDGNSLHAGLNASMDLSAYTTFGGRRHRSGLAQTVNVAYATPLGKNGSLVVGGNVSHVNEGSSNYVTGSVYAELGYRFNDQWSATIYGQKSIGSNGFYPYSYYGYPSLIMVGGPAIMVMSTGLGHLFSGSHLRLSPYSCQLRKTGITILTKTVLSVRINTTILCRRCSEILLK